jgi:hypothetical protein
MATAQFDAVSGALCWPDGAFGGLLSHGCIFVRSGGAFGLGKCLLFGVSCGNCSCDWEIVIKRGEYISSCRGIYTGS